MTTLFKLILVSKEGLDTVMPVTDETSKFLVFVERDVVDLYK